MQNRRCFFVFLTMILLFCVSDFVVAKMLTQRDKEQISILQSRVANLQRQLPTDQEVAPIPDAIRDLEASISSQRESIRRKEDEMAKIEAVYNAYVQMRTERDSLKASIVSQTQQISDYKDTMERRQLGIQQLERLNHQIQALQQ